VPIRNASGAPDWQDWDRVRNVEITVI